MNESGSKRRDWVKNVAIVFLSVMLVLTFFSNTIMNYSLPEVATKYVMPGSITAKIRGTGTVESSNPYNIQVNETRRVESVLVRSGDTVQKGDVLFILADKESNELKAAEEALDALMLDFELQILSGNVSSTVASNVQSGRTSTVAEYQSRIVAAEAEIDKWEKEIEEIELAISQLQALQSQLSVSQPDTRDAEAKLAAAQAAYDADPVKQAYDRVSVWQAEVAEYQQIIDEYEKYNTIVEVVSGNDQPVWKVTTEQYNDAWVKRDQRNQLIANEEALLGDQEKVNVYNNLKTELENAKTNLTNAQNHIVNSSNSVSVQLANWNLELSDKNKKLAEANQAKSQLLSDIASQLNLENKMEQITEQREEVNRLRDQASGAEILAPISGTISSINVIAGQDTVAGSPIATMQPEGAGYTLSFSVSNEQARKLNPGMQAELVNAWRYDDVVVTLNTIRTDPANPSSNKLLMFDVTGSVVAGQTLNLSVGDKSANYDLTVPNSAIREDNNSKFVLIVESKSSPLGNRYKATRIDVEVVASDDTTSAVKGGLSGYEFVIATSTKPVEAGQLVRHADQ